MKCRLVFWLWLAWLTPAGAADYYLEAGFGSVRDERSGVSHESMSLMAGRRQGRAGEDTWFQELHWQNMAAGQEEVRIDADNVILRESAFQSLGLFLGYHEVVLERFFLRGRAGYVLLEEKREDCLETAGVFIDVSCEDRNGFGAHPAYGASAGVVFMSHLEISYGYTRLSSRLRYSGLALVLRF